jgi:hypothetical protein
MSALVKIRFQTYCSAAITRAVNNTRLDDMKLPAPVSNLTSSLNTRSKSVISRPDQSLSTTFHGI